MSEAIDLLERTRGLTRRIIRIRDKHGPDHRPLPTSLGQRLVERSHQHVRIQRLLDTRVREAHPGASPRDKVLEIPSVDRPAEEQPFARAEQREREDLGDGSRPRADDNVVCRDGRVRTERLVQVSCEGRPEARAAVLGPVIEEVLRFVGELHV